MEFKYKLNLGLTSISVKKLSHDNQGFKQRLKCENCRCAANKRIFLLFIFIYSLSSKRTTRTFINYTRCFHQYLASFANKSETRVDETFKHVDQNLFVIFLERQRQRVEPRLENWTPSKAHRFHIDHTTSWHLSDVIISLYHNHVVSVSQSSQYIESNHATSSTPFSAFVSTIRSSWWPLKGLLRIGKPDSKE